MQILTEVSPSSTLPPTRKMSQSSLKRKASVIVLKFEEVLERLGGFGKFQLLILFLYLSLEIPTTFVTFIPIFVAKKGTWACVSDEEDESILYDYPEDQDICSCNGTIVSTSDETIVGEWGLICDKVWVADFIMGIQMLGMFIGNAYGSQIADWHGRKVGFLISTLSLALGSGVSAVAPNPYIYAASRFVCGAGIPSFINIVCMACMEFMTPKYRSLSNSIGPTGEGMMILSGLAYFFRPWRTLYWITIAPFALIIPIYPFLVESPRWLLRNNRIEEAHSVLKYMAKINGSEEVSFEALKAISEQEQKERVNSSTKRFSYLEFFREKQLRATSLYLMAIWFAWSFTYYGISYNIKNVKGSIFVNVFLLGLANSTGQRMAMLINDRLGRRRSLFASMCLCSASLSSLAVCTILLDAASDTLSICTIVFCLLGTFCMASARSSGRLLSGESFPTAVRTMGLGLGGISSNFAGVITPFLAFLGSDYPSIPFFMFAIVSVGGSLVAFLMKETTGQPLSDNINSNNDKSNNIHSSEIKCENDA